MVGTGLWSSTELPVIVDDNEAEPLKGLRITLVSTV